MEYPDGKTREEWLEALKKNRNPFYDHPETEQLIWRYMDFSKFMSLLDSRALFFPAATRLGDAFEGALSKKNLDSDYAWTATAAKDIKESFPEIKHDENHIHMGFLRGIAVSRRHLMLSRDWTFVNCWHVNDHESAAMWKLYAASDQAIAIQSTFERLYSVMEPHMVPPHGEPKLGMVHYVDYATESIRRNVHLSEFFFKRKSFAHEMELRVVKQDIPYVPKERDDKGNIISSSPDWDRDRIPGISLKVDLDRLVLRIFIAPTAPDWLHELTKRASERYGLKKEVLRSSLMDDPVF